MFLLLQLYSMVLDLFNSLVLVPQIRCLLNKTTPLNEEFINNFKGSMTDCYSSFPS